MAFASGVFKKLVIKEELVAYGTIAVAAGAAYLRRVTSTLDLSKDTYQSNEIAEHMQVQDMRHGVRRVQGAISGELAPGSYTIPFAALLRKAWTATTAATAVSLTIAGTGPGYTVTRAAGDWLTGGFKVGDVVRLSVGTLHANNINKNLLITNLTATVMSVVVLNATAMQAEGPIAGCTITVIGKKTFAANTAHTDQSFSIEHWSSDVAQSEVFTGCKFTQAAIDLPATGLATVNFDVRGQNVTTGTAAYFTTPSAALAGPSLAAVNGVIRVGGAAVASITGANVTIGSAFTGDPVVGSNVVPNQFPGRVTASGQLTAYFENATMRDMFLNETEGDVILVLTGDNSATAEFVTLVMPRVKLGGASKDDGEKGIVQTIPFTALYNSAGGSGVKTEKTTLSMQDSLAP